MNADERRYFLAFAYGKENNKRFYSCSSVFICGYKSLCRAGIVRRTCNKYDAERRAMPALQ